jgi:uncharacterized repeat protein (TIGR03803 family)
VLLLLALASCGGGGSSNPQSVPVAVTLQSVKVAPAAPSVTAGSSTQLTATAVYSDNSHVDVTAQASWISSNPIVADVAANTGAVTTTAQGNTLMTATYQGLSGSSTLIVTNAVAATILYPFLGIPDGSHPIKLIQGSDGNLYGITGYGGAHPGTDVTPDPLGGGTVFKLTPSGVESVLYSFVPGDLVTASPGGWSPRSLIQGSDGNFYGTTSNGGAYNAGAVFMLTPAGVETVLYAFGGPQTGGTDGAQPRALVLGLDGNFYGTTSTSGTFQGTIFKLTPSGVETRLYSFPGSSAAGALIQANDGNFYGVAYPGSGQFGAVYRMTPAGVVSQLHTFDGGPEGWGPVVLMQANDGNLYGATSGGIDSSGHFNNESRLFKLTLDGTLTVLYTFGPNADGTTVTDLIQGADGNLYGLTALSAQGGGMVFKCTLTGVLTVLYGFTNGPDGGSPSALIQAKDGTFYGVASSGGTGSGVAFQLQ